MAIIVANPISYAENSSMPKTRVYHTCITQLSNGYDDIMPSVSRSVRLAHLHMDYLRSAWFPCGQRSTNNYYY